MVQTPLQQLLAVPLLQLAPEAKQHVWVVVLHESGCSLAASGQHASDAQLAPITFVHVPQ